MGVMPKPVLRQKLALPPIWKGALARPRLEGLLDAAVAEGAHVAVCAGAGWGKTMGLSRWALAQRDRADGPAVAWLTLDAEDADLDGFLTYLVAAFEHALPGFQSEARGMLGRAREREGAQAALEALVADLDEQADRPVVLVIDDLHLAASPSLDALLERMLRYLPPRVRLVLASRRRPAIALATLQAQRQLVLLEEAALAFDADELPAVKAEVLAATGGWPAAMGMPTELLDAYLEEQLLAGLEPDLIRFLGKAALVEGFDARLCAEALGEPFSPARRERLLAERLIHAYGPDRFTLHPSLRSMLARRHAAEHAPAERRDLLARVAEHLASRGEAGSALDCWLAAGEAARAAEQLAAVAEPWLAEGRLEALERAVAALGPAADHPALWAVRGEVHRRWGEAAEAARCYERALDADAPERGRARARLGLAQLAASQGRLEEAREHLQGLADADDDLAVDRAILEGGLAMLAGETAGALAKYQAAAALARRLDDRYGQARAAHNMGVCHGRMGDFARALEAYDGASALAAEDGTPLVWMSPINRALVLVQLGRSEEAVTAARDALALVRRYRHAREEGYALRILGLAQQARGAHADAETCFATAEQLARAGQDALGLAYSLNLAADLALARGDVATALARVDEVEAALGGPDAALARDMLEFPQVRAHAYAAAGEPTRARALVEAVLPVARAKGFVHIARDLEQLVASLETPTVGPSLRDARSEGAVGLRPVQRSVQPPGSADEPELVVSCLGGVRVLAEGREITEKAWTTARAKQLFLFLLFTPEGATKPHLLASVFGGEEVTNDLMNVTLLRLRKALEPHLEKGQPSRYILRADGRYAFNRQARVAIDVQLFEAALRAAAPGAPDEVEALDRALALYGGDFAPQFEAAWIVARRLQLKTAALEACRRLLALYDAREPARALPLLQRALAIDPVAEEFHRELILRYIEAGEPSRAREQFGLCERYYRELVGMPPPDDLADLVRPL